MESVQKSLSILNVVMDKYIYCKFSRVGQIKDLNLEI